MKQTVSFLSKRNDAIQFIRENAQQSFLRGVRNPILFLDGKEWGRTSQAHIGTSNRLRRYLFSDFIAWLEVKEGSITVQLNPFFDSSTQEVKSGETDTIKSISELKEPISKQQITEIESLQDPWIALQHFRNALPGYHAGYLGYDLKNSRENLNSLNMDPTSLPDLWIGYPAQVMIIEEDPIQESFLGVESKMDEALVGSENKQVFELESQISKEEYIKTAEEAKRKIKEGDYYELNLSVLFSGQFTGEALDLYQKMSSNGQQPLSAYFSVEEFEICSASPERFLLKSDNSLFSSPMKGTAPRSGDPIQDRMNKELLRESEKERAENLMIVDLVRNDFSRVCTPGSVETISLFEVHSYPTVHQMISTVTGELRNEIQTEEAIASCFPMGSMTGAPKISAMEDIERLEAHKRGVYSGAIGFFTPEGDFDFNVVIRTAFCRNDGVFTYAAGSAITSDADPEKEWSEILLKTAVLGHES